MLVIALSQCLGFTPLALANTEALGSKKAAVVSKTPPEIREELEKKISTFLLQLVEKSATEPNEYLQVNIKKIADTAKESYAKSLRKNMHLERSGEALEWDFSFIWMRGINRVIEREEVQAATDLEKALTSEFNLDEASAQILGETSASDEESETTLKAPSPEDTGTPLEAARKKAKVLMTKTTLLNILLRQKDCREKAQKVRTIIEMGADKNLNEEFRNTPRMENQKEYPLKIALEEISDMKTRLELVTVIFDEKAIYSRNEILPNEKLKGIKDTLESNKEYLTMSLLERNDYEVFSRVMDKAEDVGLQFVQEYTDEASQIHDQLYSPLLETILSKMRDIRRQTYSSNSSGEAIDNIKEFLNSKRMRRQTRLNSEARFSLYFQNHLNKDFDSLFAKIAQHIDETRISSELAGKDFKSNLLSWVALANFRNRVCRHLNKFALTASNNAKKSNVIRLIRLANTYDKGHEGNDEVDKFRELEEFGGKEIIFATKNKLKWTPAMYAMVQKQSEGIQLLLKQAFNKVTDVDGVGNNIFHLAFPLPEQFFKGELTSDSGNVLELIGSALSNTDARSKTNEAIKAITFETGIPTEDKVKALNTTSGTNFTPVALAATTGDYKTFEVLKEYLLQNNAWNEDDHAYLGTHIEELMWGGLRAYLKAKDGQKSLSRGEREQLVTMINAYGTKINQKYAHCVKEIYQPEIPIAAERLKKIEKAAMTVLEDFNSKPATKRKVDPYKAALQAAMDKMTAPRWNLLGTSTLAGMRESTSVVKASYLRPVLKKVTKEFLSKKPTPKDMTFDKVYEGLTGSLEKTFFAEHFNRSVEKMMHITIIETVREEGRLREEVVESDQNNRFKNVEDEYLSDKNDKSKEDEDSASSEEPATDKKEPAKLAKRDPNKEWAF